jgi:hypothetical protein
VGVQVHGTHPAAGSTPVTGSKRNTKLTGDIAEVKILARFVELGFWLRPLHAAFGGLVVV